MSIELAPREREGRAVYILIPLLLLHMTLISLQVEDPQGTLLFRKTVLAVSAPIFNFFSAGSRAVRNTWNGYFWLRGARQENERLRESLRQLALREQALEPARQENERLRRLLGVKERLAFPSISSHVIGRSPDYLSNVAYIDRGSGDGIQPNAPVLAVEGIIGRVTIAFAGTSQVQLVTNPDASIGVMVERTQSLGVAKGLGQAALLLDYIGFTEQILIGDTVVTSGLDGIFPGHLPVGRVTSSKKGRAIFREIEVELFADPMRARDVLVLPPVPARR